MLDERISGTDDAVDLAELLAENEELETDLLDGILGGGRGQGPGRDTDAPVDRQKLREEIAILARLAEEARSIRVDTKSRTLLKALETGFEQMAAVGAARKAVIFTESRRTQEYLKQFLEANGHTGQLVLFNGSNNGPEETAIYERWLERNQGSDKVTGSRAVNVRTALIEHFRDHASILIATEAAAEGLNSVLLAGHQLRPALEPQRIEQRIGRCHRYGQKHDVVVINFLNERNEADRRVLELLERSSTCSAACSAPPTRCWARSNPAWTSKSASSRSTRRAGP